MPSLSRLRPQIHFRQEEFPPRGTTLGEYRQVTVHTFRRSTFTGGAVELFGQTRSTFPAERQNLRPRREKLSGCVRKGTLAEDRDRTAGFAHQSHCSHSPLPKQATGQTRPTRWRRIATGG
jgi:hypothetical protein